ncbi:hypothetical protein NC796_06825 [Aliifodinibius sp. S!AR15-10]|uniref:hypothetical protein n=1 Tax=Aliifodinibius sp. S!AR15-10 TaxID=2950437 RepID=UPI0028621B17|nr:hypothetical protein [Aliifodinibius sp. S!AR15-10]MDR8390842.1 hypothetical protein [Aliifodinibius sp. S!AR15-10]
MSKYSVKKCICHDRTFQEIKDYSQERGISSIEELQAEQYCSCQCKFCVPYIEMMFETGQTVFEPGAYLTEN